MSYYKLKNTIKEIFNYNYTIPCHQGRAAENLLFPILYKDKKDKLELETKNAAEVLFKLDYKISPNSDNSDNIEKENYYDFYSTCLHNLKKDIDMLNNAVNDLSKFTNLGIELGNAFEKVNEQKDYLVNKIIDANKYLKNMEKTTFEMMDIVTINDNS